MFQGRSAGILLPISSLPSDGPIGDFGQEAYDFLVFMEQAGQRWWQILPLNPLNPVGSPYASTSSFALEKAYLNLRRAFDDCKLTADEDLNKAIALGSRQAAFVDYERLWEIKLRAFECLLLRGSLESLSDAQEFLIYKTKNADWLDDYALFEALREHYRTSDWSFWAKELRDRDQAALFDAEREFAKQIEGIKWIQFLVETQWQAIKSKAREHGVSILGDMPFYVSLRSADVWANQGLFHLDPKTRRANLVAGVPPDPFNPYGQKWGNALFNWQRMQETGFRWWLARVGRQLELYDALRLDHFIGFYRSWHVPLKASNAVCGSWDYAPGLAMLEALKRSFPRMPFVAEDLGSVTAEVFELRDEFKLPGMRVMQFGFGGAHDRTHLPHNYIQNCIAYTGTHDNNTFKGWLQQLKKERSLRALLTYIDSPQTQAAQKAIRSLYASVANTVIIPLQDILGLGSSARINRPGEEYGNWQWRLGDLRYEWHSAYLSRLAGIYER